MAAFGDITLKASVAIDSTDNNSRRELLMVVPCLWKVVGVAWQKRQNKQYYWPRPAASQPHHAVEFRNTSLTENQGMYKGFHRYIYLLVSLPSNYTFGVLFAAFDDNNDENGEILIENDLPACLLPVYLCCSCSDLSTGNYNRESYSKLINPFFNFFWGRGLASISCRVSLVYFV